MCLPGCDLQGDHYEFVEDESSKRDRNDMQELVLKKHKRHNHDRRALVETNHQPLEERLVRQRSSLARTN